MTTDNIRAHLVDKIQTLNSIISWIKENPDEALEKCEGMRTDLLNLMERWGLK